MAETLMMLPLLGFVDGRARSAWADVVALADRECALTAEQRHRLLHRGPSQSDRMGIASFAAKVEKSQIALGPFLAKLLRQQLPSNS
jgi:hypothetical protein